MKNYTGKKLAFVRKIIKKSLCFIITLEMVLASLVIAPQEVKAAGEMVLETNVAAATAGNTMLGVYGTYYTDAQNALDRINAIRYEACNAGDVPDPRDSTRMLSPSDYVPLSWSRDLEQIARIRAVEGGLAYSMYGSGHSRLNKGDIWFSINGVSANAENLAYNFNRNDLVSGINQWYGEKSDWVNRVSGKVTGHYTSIINPNFKCIGLGDFYAEETGQSYPNTLCGLLSSKSGLNSEMLQGYTNIIQKIEVNSFYVNYILDGAAKMFVDESQTVHPRAMVSNGNGGKAYAFRILDNVTLSSSAEEICSVDSDGLVVAKGKGTVIISAKSGDTTLASLTINVTCNHNKKLQGTDPATCQSPGTNHYSCSKCGEDFSETIPVGPHAYVYGTADSTGMATGVCSICSDTVIIKPPTSFKLLWRNTTTATDGYYWTSIPTSNPQGSTISLWGKEFDGQDGYNDLIVESSDEDILSVSNNGVLNATSASNGGMIDIKVLRTGIVNLTIYPKYNSSLKRTFTLRVGNAGGVNIADAEATLSKSNYDYTGSACMPAVSSVEYRGFTLTRGTDYNTAISYEDNINAGTAKVIITGAGIFGGTLEKEFIINPINLSTYQMTLAGSSYEYDGSEKTPAVTVKKTSSSAALVKDKDYYVIYENNEQIGKATVKVQGSGNYTGTIAKTFDIVHTAHTYEGEWTVAEEPTYITKGAETQKCKYCSETTSRGVPELKYSIHFEGNGADAGSMTDQINLSFLQGGNLTKNNFAKEDCIFDFWSTEENGNGERFSDKDDIKKLVDLAKENEGSITLYAIWKATPHKYYFICHGNGATNTSAGLLRFETKSGEKLPKNTYEKKGYHFIGWATEPDGKGDWFEDEQELENLPSTYDNKHAILLYAQWELDKYNLTYVTTNTEGQEIDLSDNTDNPKDYTFVQEDFSINHLPEANPTKTGYTFAGWYADEKFKTKVTKIKKGSVGSRKLYAKWVANTYTIHFEPNGGTGRMSDMKSRAYDKSYALTANAFKMPEKQFDYWSESPLGNAETLGLAMYDNKDTVKNLGSENGEIITLYAHWKEPEYAITYKNYNAKTDCIVSENLAEEGCDKLTLPTMFREDTDNIFLPAIERPGYVFEGWYKDAKYRNPIDADNLKTPQVVAVPTGTRKDMVFYAKWSADSYVIHFDSGVAEGVQPVVTGNMSDVTTSYGKSVTLKGVGYKRPYYVFAGWKAVYKDFEDVGVDRDEIQVDYENKAKILDPYDENGQSVDKMTLVAQWIPISYKIVYKNYNDKTDRLYKMEAMNSEDLSLVTTYTYESEDIYLPRLSRIGYDFDGWYLDSKFKKPLDETNATANGLTEPTVPGISAKSNGNKTLYAKFTPKKYYSIVFVEGNTSAERTQVTGTVKNQTKCICGTTYTLPNNAFKRTGYTFAGWKIAKAIEGDWANEGVEPENANYGYELQCDLQNKQKVTHLELGASESGDVVILVAQWTPTAYKVTYKNIMQGKPGVKADITATYNIESGKIDHPMPREGWNPGYKFEGWYLDAKFTKPSDSIPANSTGNKTYYAKWVKLSIE